MNHKSGREVRDLIQARGDSGLCPICGEVPQPPCKLVRDSNIFFKEESVKVCVFHIVEDQMCYGMGS